MNKILVMLMLGSGLILNSCKKDITSNEVSGKSDYNPLTNSAAISSQASGLITLLAQCAYSPSNPTSKQVSYAIEGRIVDGTIGGSGVTALDAGSLLLNGNTMTKTSDFIYRNVALNGSGYYGTNALFEITGNVNNGINPTQTSFYIPTLIYMSQPSALVLSKSASNKISWNPDPNYKGDVYVSVIYKGTQSHDLDSVLPTNDIVFSDKTSDNNGFYLIPSNAISQMPVGGIVEITIGRGNYSTVNTGNKNVIISAATITYNNFKLLQ